jgi:hypothetical protein
MSVPVRLISYLVLTIIPPAASQLAVVAAEARALSTAQAGPVKRPGATVKRSTTRTTTISNLSIARTRRNRNSTKGSMVGTTAVHPVMFSPASRLVTVIVGIMEVHRAIRSLRCRRRREFIRIRDRHRRCMVRRSEGGRR